MPSRKEDLLRAPFARFEMPKDHDGGLRPPDGRRGPEDNEWHYTQYMARDPKVIYGPDGTPFHNKLQLPVITRDTKRVLPGVSIIPGIQEAIVVELHDPQYPDALDLQKLNAQIYTNLIAQGKLQNRGDILKGAYLEVMKYFGGPGTSSTVDKQEKMLDDRGIGVDDPVSINLFIREKCGVCRHRALVLAAVLQSFKDSGYLRGDAFYNRSIIGRDGHAWVRYVSNSGEPIIADPMQGYFGYLKDSPKHAGWDYHQPTDDRDY